METPTTTPPPQTGVMMCPQEHIIFEYTPNYTWLDGLREQALAESKAASTEINLAAVTSAVTSDICCDVCFQADNGRHRNFHRCKEDCNYDLCMDCYAAKKEVFSLALTVTSGSQQGQSWKGVMEIQRFKVTGVGDEVLSDVIRSITVNMFGEVCGPSIPSRGATIVFKDGVMTQLRFSHHHVNHDGVIHGYGFNSPDYKAKDGIPANEPLWFGYRTAEGQVDGFGTYTFTRVKLAEVDGFFGKTTSKEVWTQVVLDAVLSDHVLETVTEMRKKTTLPPTRRQRMALALYRSLGFVAKTATFAEVFQEASITFLKNGYNPDEWSYKADTATRPGKVTFDEMIYCARLSQLAYLTSEIGFAEFFPMVRQDLLLDKVWYDVVKKNKERRASQANAAVEMATMGLVGVTQEQKKLADTAAGMFLVNQIAGFFNRDPNEPGFFGLSKPIQDRGGPLAKMHLEMSGETVMKWKNVECFVASSQNFETEGGDVIVSFQGTNDAQDLITNFEGILTPFEPLTDFANPGSCSSMQRFQKDKANVKALVHTGFYTAFLGLRPQIERALNHLFKAVAAKPDINCRVVVTGHSLGGAMACICYAWLLQWFDDVLTPADKVFKQGKVVGLPINMRLLCITFGQPKVGNQVFCDFISKHRFCRVSTVRAIEKVSKHGDKDWLSFDVNDEIQVVDMDSDTVWMGQLKNNTGKFELNKVQKLRTNDARPKAKYLRILDFTDPVPHLPPNDMGYRHVQQMAGVIDSNGDFYFLPWNMARLLDKTSGAIYDIIKKIGKDVLQYHDLTVYMFKTIYFAKKQCMARPMGLLEAFGDMDYEAKTKTPEFLDQF